MASADPMKKKIRKPNRNPDFVHTYDEYKTEGWILDQNRILTIHYLETKKEWCSYIMRFNSKFPWIEVIQDPDCWVYGYVDNRLDFFNSSSDEYQEAINKEINSWLFNKELEKALKKDPK